MRSFVLLLLYVHFSLLSTVFSRILWLVPIYSVDSVSTVCPFGHNVCMHAYHILCVPTVHTCVHLYIESTL